MPATSMMSVVMPASFFVTGALPVPVLPTDTWPLAFPLTFSAIPFGTSSSLRCGARSCLPEYSEDGSRRRGVACFVRAIAGRG